MTHLPATVAVGALSPSRGGESDRYQASETRNQREHQGDNQDL